MSIRIIEGLRKLQQISNFCPEEMNIMLELIICLNLYSKELKNKAS